MQARSLIILFVILVSLIPVYMINRSLQQIIRPRDSLSRLFLYLFSGFALVFIYTFLLVFLIKKLFPGA
ncbi:MAG TPA: hypothetical protein VFX58_02770 [Chitinophagaceae bacterium]|nr:hypothetical protein [Chitinophagaceae bacterium]